MFEAVKGQDVVIRMLEHEINRNRLPQALLFYGPEGCGKFLTAIELVRILRCTGLKSTSCNCRSCYLIRNLLSKDVLIISKAEMRNTFSLWRLYGIQKEDITYFISDLRRLLISRADELQYKGTCEALEELIRVREKIIDHYDKIMELVDNLTRTSKGRIISIERVREVQRFLSIRSDDGGYRSVILDGAEHMNEEASNAFLKISEDTPHSGIIILTSVQPHLIKETIRSRCRSYRFIRLNKEVIQMIYLDRFKYTPNRIGDSESCYEVSAKYLQKIVDIRHEPYRLVETVEEIVANEHEIEFLDYLTDLLRVGVSALSDLDMVKLKELEGLFKSISFLKNAILYSHINPQIAIFDFILNNYRKILHYININSDGKR
ncbi:MAG: hypothetical protein ACUVWJ_06980 [Spirochaetota bacterium]